jgi:hypothetical protein
MAEVLISRAPTKEEAKNYISLGMTGALPKNCYSAFLQKLGDVTQKYTKLFRPFDHFSAKMDFEEKVRNVIGAVNSSIVSESIIADLGIDLDSYAEPNKFELIEINDIKEDKLIDGLKTSAITGKSFTYRCKVRKNVVVVMVPNYHLEHVDAWVAENFTNSPELEKALEQTRPKSLNVEKKAKKKEDKGE